MHTANVAPPALELRLSGSFDLPAARALAETLIAAGRVRIVLDFGHARELHADALALLSRALQLVGERVSLRGLTRHHVRLFRYLGVPSGSLERERPAPESQD